MLSQDQKDLLMTKLTTKEPNRFLLSVAVSKRARQLKEGAPAFISLKKGELLLPVITALNELGMGKISLVMTEQKGDDEVLIDEIHQYVQAEDQAEAEDEDKPKKDSKSKSKNKSLAA